MDNFSNSSNCIFYGGKSRNNLHKKDKKSGSSNETEYDTATIDDFPYRKYMLEHTIRYRLEKILTSKPVIKKEYWSIPNGKVILKINPTPYQALDMVIAPTIEDHWQYDQIIDYYSEFARIKTPGYGEKYSPYDYWFNKDLHGRWVGKNTDKRESIYESITEARPAYSTIAISLYYALSQFTDIKNHITLDIAAYGERAIAAASLGYEYHGVDPNYDLVDGHTKLIMDLQCIKPCNVKFYYIGLEDFKSVRKFSIITYSPPPFNTEPYSGNKEMQSYNKYPTFMEYFCCFLTEIIYKASCIIEYNGIFSFTALDRNPKQFSIKIKDKELISENLELIYVEALLLLINCLGFEYKGAIGLSAGRKQAQVPWWTFIYNRTYSEKNVTLFMNNYSDIFAIIGSRILVNYINTSLFNNFIDIDEYPNFNVSKVNINKRELTYDQRIFLELCRLRIQMYISSVISLMTNVPEYKVRTILGRYLMLRSITSTFESPWLSNLYVDSVFPVYNINTEEIDEHVISNFEESKCTNARYVVKECKYWFGSYEVIGLAKLYDAAAHYITTIPLSQINLNIKKLFPNKIIITGHTDTINILKRVPGTTNVSNILWEDRMDLEINDQNLLIYLRYDTLAAKGHQYTRSRERTKIIENIFGNDIIDIYASIYNNQSEKYCSIYPDVELDSYGSAFCLQMKEGAYLANPVDFPIFLKYSVKHILHNLNNAERLNKQLYVSMAFTLWLDTNPNFIKDFSKSNIRMLLKNSDNYGLKILADNKFVKVIYILDKSKFPSMIYTKKEQLVSSSNRSENTISVGVMLTTSSSSLNYKEISKLVKDDSFIKIIE